MLEPEAQAKQWKEAKLEVKYNYWKAMQMNYEVLNESLQNPFDDHNSEDNLIKPSSRSSDILDSTERLKKEHKSLVKKGFDIQMTRDKNVQNIELSKSEESKSDEYSDGYGDESSSSGEHSVKYIPQEIKNRSSKPQLILWMLHTDQKDRFKLWDLLTNDMKSALWNTLDYPFEYFIKLNRYKKHDFSKSIESCFNYKRLLDSLSSVDINELSSNVLLSIF
jgi:hypothetical protein